MLLTHISDSSLLRGELGLEELTPRGGAQPALHPASPARARSQSPYLAAGGARCPAVDQGSGPAHRLSSHSQVSILRPTLS